MHRRGIRRRAAVLAAAILSMATIMPASAQGPLAPQDPPAAADDRFEAEGTGLWFVQLRSAPAADGTAPGQLKKDRSAFKDEAKANGITYSQRFDF